MDRKNEFEEVDVLKDPDGLVAVITGRTKPNGRRAYSFMIAKEYDKDGDVHRTCWLGPNHYDGVTRLLDRVAKRIEQEEDRDRARARSGS